MIRKILLAIILATFTITLNAQGYWKLERFTDDYTMEKKNTVVHYSNHIIDAIYYVNTNFLCVFKEYDGLAYLNTCFNAMIYNDGKIDDYKCTVYSRLINNSSDYEEAEFKDKTISYHGYADDDKIDENGFISAFGVFIKPEQLKKANYITFQYYDKISGQTIKQKISLAGFTKAYNSIK